MKTTATVIVEACGSAPSSSAMTVKTIDARPRGPNQPTNATVRRLRVRAERARCATGTMRTTVRLSTPYTPPSR